MSQHIEFPPLTFESQSVLKVAGQELTLRVCDGGTIERRFCAAAIREAMQQSGTWNINSEFPRAIACEDLAAIADNLHSPPPPPTLEEMQQALQELENWRQIEGAAIPAAGVSAGRRLEILRRGIAHYCHD